VPETVPACKVRPPPLGTAGGPNVNRLIAYLRENMILDFQGDLTLEMVRDFLKEDNSREARTLLAKLVEERGVSEMMLVLADCLLEVVQERLTDDRIREQLRIYSES
jgi:hypothetical protein